jgi:hypothetical protein
MHDGRHDFDFEVGTWKIAPSGYGHVVRRLWDGATIAQLIVRKPSRRVRGSLLSIYNPSSRQWSIYWADAQEGTLSAPLLGHFRNGIGTFVSRDTANGGAITRLCIFNITSRSFQTIQDQSHDGGHTWSGRRGATFTRQ